VLNKRAFTTTYVRHVFGPAFTETAFPLVLNGPVHFSFFDFGNPSTFTPTDRDRLAGPPAAAESNCDTAGPSGTEMPTYLLQNGNINVYGPVL